MKRALSIVSLLCEFLASQECRIWLRAGRKPLLVLAVVGGLCWLGGQWDAQLARAEAESPAALACPIGLEQGGALCYPPCSAGYYGDGPICVQRCPADTKDDIGFCRKDAHIFAKASYGRGAGVPLTCAPNQEGQNGLCYPRCNVGYTGIGPVCWQACRAGYADHGATCFKNIFDFYFKATYGRGAGGPVTACAAGQERNGSLCYPRCSPGFYGSGPLCFQQCPVGYKDDGAVCRKDAIIFAKATFGRGAGSAMNSVPTVNNESYTTPKDTPVQLNYFFEDLNNDSTTLIIVQQPRHGQEANNTYTPNPGFEGLDTILWKVNDGKHDSTIAMTTILVGNVGANAAPVAIDRTIAVSEDTPIMVTVTCTDANEDELFYALIDKPQHGTYEWVSPNQVIYTPTLNFAGVDHFTFRAYDGRDFSTISTITLTVAAENDAPLAVVEPLTVTRNSNAAIKLFVSDAENEPISYTVVSSPTHGLLRGAAPDWLYTPNQDFVGSDSLQLQMRDPNGGSSAATIQITVLPTNTAPLAESLVLTTSTESALAVNLAARDADQDALQYSIVTTPTHGALSGDGADWVYTPAAGFTGDDAFSFKVNDGLVDSLAATVTLQVVAAATESSLGGLVFDDVNGNGQPDANETGVSGLEVTLLPATPLRTTFAFTTTTDAIGAWRMDGVPFGEYTVEIAASDAVQLRTPLVLPVTLTQRGLYQLQPSAVQVAGGTLYLPVVVR